MKFDLGVPLSCGCTVEGCVSGAVTRTPQSLSRHLDAHSESSGHLPWTTIVRPTSSTPPSRRGPQAGEFDAPKQERTRQQLERILEEADRLFAERGYRATKLSDIAAAVPCSMSAIYDRFGGKAELLRYMHRRGAEEAVALVDALEPLGDTERGDPGDLRDTLHQALEMGLAIIRRYRGRRRASLERMYDDPELAEIELGIQNGVVEAGRRYLLAYRHQFDHPDPELAATQAMRLLMAMVEQRESTLPSPGGATLSEQQFIAEVERMVLGYLGIAHDSDD